LPPHGISPEAVEKQLIDKALQKFDLKLDQGGEFPGHQPAYSDLPHGETRYSEGRRRSKTLTNATYSKRT